METRKLVVINGSYRDNGTTKKCLESVAERIRRKHRMGEVVWVSIPSNFRGCINCGLGKCVAGCRIADDFQGIVDKLRGASRVLIGTPVYLDFPSPKLLALLSRLNCMAEPTQRKFFRGMKVHLHANGYCSGTKAAVGVLMNACEMLGFTIEGRSTTEYIEIWHDHKIRGGMPQDPRCLVKD